MILPIFTVKKMKTHTKNFFSNDMKKLLSIMVSLLSLTVSTVIFWKKKFSKFFDFFFLIVILYHFSIFHSKFHISDSNFFENFFSKTKKSDFPW